MRSVVIAENMVIHKAELEKQFLRSFNVISIIPDFETAKAVFIKPNLTFPYYKEGVTTRRDFVAALVHSLRKINTATKIYIGEGEGGYNSFCSMTEAMRVMGFFEIAETYSNIEIVNLQRLERESRALSERKSLCC